MPLKKYDVPMTRKERKDFEKYDLRPTAYHEAGHVLAEWVCHDLFGFKRVCVRPDADSVGYLDTLDNGDGLINVFASHNSTAETHLMRCLICDLAGFCAETMFRTSNPAWFSEMIRIERKLELCDFYRSALLVKSIFHNPVLENQILQKAACWTEQLLRHPTMWKIIDDIAIALIKKRELNKEQVLKIISMTWKNMTVMPYCAMGNKWHRRLYIPEETLRAA
jgi:hypothetical protein